MSTDFKIRSAAVEDLPHILSLIRELAEYEKLSHEVTATEELLRQHLFGEGRAGEVILACAQGECVGFAVFFQNFSTFLGKPGIYLEDLYVRPAFRGRGFGKALMVYLARLASERGCGRFEWSVLDWNSPSIEFYRSIGAVPLSEWTVQRMTGQSIARLAAQRLPGEEG